jgi:hypothetical protein
LDLKIYGVANAVFISSKEWGIRIVRVVVDHAVPTELPHKFSYIVAILAHNHFESQVNSVQVAKTHLSFATALLWH